MACPTGVPPSTQTSLGAPPTPRFGVSEARLQNPGRENAPREREWLFDIVRRELPKTVRRRAASSAVLILRSARAPTARQSRMGVRASRMMRAGRAAHFGKPSGGAGADNQPAAGGNGRWFALPVSSLLF